MAERALPGIGGLDVYIAELHEDERDFALEMWDALEDKIGSNYPLRADWCIEFHRELEILGVLSYYHDQLCAERKAAHERIDLNHDPAARRSDNILQ